MNAITNNTALNRYELDREGQVVFADCRRAEKMLSILHVEAPPRLRVRGATGRFMQGLMEKIREEELKVVPLCGYAASWLNRHPEYQSLIA